MTKGDETYSNVNSPAGGILMTKALGETEGKEEQFI
jgi:hypothetical protein